MQTLRKKTSPLKYKNETTRFLGDGVCFKAKLIGILEVSEARGDRMCQEALSDLKMAIRAAGEHKQRITIHIALDGLRLRDEKTGDSLYHHPVHKISFIAQDMTDSRAFGYIFGAPDTGHRFFGIKTDKAASQVVIAMRDLFQVVFALKKKEIELAKIHLEKTRYPTSPLFSGEGSTSKLSQDKTSTETKSSGAVAEAKSSGTAVADLVDLELELNSLQQGLNQMERITPSDPFGSKDDPFGDSFISYPKPILPPPPSSGRERSSRTSESSSIFSPKTPHTTVSLDNSSVATGDSLTTKKDFSFSHDFSTSHDEPSSGDWFTPSAGNSLFEDPPLVPPEPQKDDKHELQKQEILSQFDVFTELDPLELKNPPKKVLNDLVSSTTSSSNQNAENLFANFNQNKSSVNASGVASVFSSDPFGEDPFVKEDPFAEADFSKQDPFENDFNDRFKDQFDKFKFEFNKTSSEKSPKYLEKQMSVGISGTSPKTVQFQKQNTFDVQYDKFDDRKFSKLSQLHENPSLDMSSESECAPEPPPRPQSSLMQIKPPPLPPKKQNDLAVRPPPRPPHSEESHYDYMDNYETSTTEYKCLQDKSPPLPVPARKSKFESDFNAPAPERPKKNFNLQSSSEEDYLQPVGMEKVPTSGILLPPPQKSKKHNLPSMQVTVSSYLENKPHVTTSNAQSSDRERDPSLEGLDITLSQLTLSGLNELAQKLNIPPSQLSNMTLVQLTNYLSNFIRTKAAAKPHSCTSEHSANTSEQFATFQADFAANFSNSTTTTTADTTYDRYAVFRELMQEEIKQTKIDTEPEQLKEEQKLENNNEDHASNPTVAINNLNISAIKNDEAVDKYAALRDIEIEIKQDDTKIENVEQETEKSNETIIEENMNKENKLNSETVSETKNYIEEYNNANIEKVQAVSPKSPQKIKSPIPSAVTEIIQSNTRLNSGSLSDVVSGSSPEVDNTNNSDRDKKMEDATGESWAIFDQGNNGETHHKQVQSEEGVSPWSSDSKEFGNGSPPEYRRHDRGPGSGRKDEKEWKRRRDQEGWWDTSAEPEGPYYPSNRRSNDSYEEEYYECYDRPRRRRPANWSSTAGAGGHSSSSRDVSPWEEEPRRRDPREGSRDGRWSAGRHARGPSFDRHKDRRRDSWEDEEEDYEYDDERERYHWAERHGSRESDRDRHSTGSRDRDHDGERWDERSEDRRHRRRREVGSRDRWCCPDWEQGEHEKGSRYGSGRWSGEGRRGGGDRKHEPHYYSRDSQESPWEDEYSNGPEDAHNYYLSTKRYGKPRPSSASEMDRKTGEIKSRHNLGGSDGERDRRYKSNRRSRSRDSQYAEPPHRHPKPEPGNVSRQIRKVHHKAEIEKTEGKVDISKKSATLSGRKKKESPKTEESCSTFPRKSASRNSKSPFENDFVPTPDEDVPTSRTVGAKFNFDDFETSEAESPTIARPIKETRIKSPRYSSKKSLFEDDFSPSDKVLEVENISSIKEESDVREEEDTFSDYNTTTTNNNNNSTRKKILAARLGSGGGGRVGQGDNLKKSESVNIFARENDPFDDDFFSGTAAAASNLDGDRPSPRTTELRWTRDFQNFDADKK